MIRTAILVDGGFYRRRAKHQRGICSSQSWHDVKVSILFLILWEQISSLIYLNTLMGWNRSGEARIQIVIENYISYRKR